EMLRRVVTLGPSQISIAGGDQAAATMEAKPQASTSPASSAALQPVQRLAGYGQLGSPLLTAAPIAPDKLDTTSPGPDHLPGYYGPSGAAKAFNIVTATTRIRPLPTVEGANEMGGYRLRKPMALEPWLYFAALALFIADVLAML